jgi:DNA-binding transcriptional ArsR family regulator
MTTLPVVVAQALDDVQLPHVCRLAMWHLRLRLDGVHYVEVKAASLASEMRVKERTVSLALERLTQDGYLDEHHKQRPRAFRLPWARLLAAEVRRAA